MKDGRVEDQECQDLSRGFMIAFFERVWKTLPFPWLEKLLPFKYSLEVALVIHSLALLLTTALEVRVEKMVLPTYSKDDQIINLKGY